ncbi:DUF4304 domain-containing protein [Limnovirga soli]|uniref:DUF4304 domain-containing protein n=1 Tax=Limnovirga soli TaxID=2656915 RepID=A0A8J8JYU1_9BACT|nr:DUF4304 domain-containing protein [Limnovirga soli]NNV57651.1 DUF4304 domain-containing protein [Limnovirga soli]
MIINQKDFYKLIDSILSPLGFIKKKETWYLHTDDCICFFAAAKSPYGGYYGHVMGCFLKEIYEGEDEFPKYYKYNLIYSISDLAQKDLVKKAFDLENNEFVKGERETIIEDLIVNYALPFLNSIKTKSGIKIAINEYTGLKYGMDLKIKNALSIED